MGDQTTMLFQQGSSFFKLLTKDTQLNLITFLDRDNARGKALYTFQLGALFPNERVRLAYKVRGFPVTNTDKTILTTRPMGHVAHLRQHFKSINTYGYIITLIMREKNPLSPCWELNVSSFEQTWTPSKFGWNWSWRRWKCENNGPILIRKAHLSLRLRWAKIYL